MNIVDVLKLEVENTPTGLVNLIQNPSGEYGGSGWITPIEGTSFRRDVTKKWLLYQHVTFQVNYFWTESFAVTPGQYVAARFIMAAPLGYAVRALFEWLDASGTVVGSSTRSAYFVSQSGNGLANGGETRAYAAQQVPTGASRGRLRLEYTGGSSQTAPSGQSNVLYLREVTVAKAATAAALNGLGYLESASYTNVLGPTHTISVKRDELNVGILTAEILDSTLDPSQSDLVRPGKRCRVMALDATTSTWTPLFTGKVSSGATKYDPAVKAGKRVRVSLTALDAASQLAQVARPNGAQTLGALAETLEGAGVPWSIDGFNGQGGATPGPRNENASALDQVAIARDTSLGYAWVDRRGMLAVWSRSQIPTTVAATLDETAYSDFDLDFDTDRCINVVTVKLRRTNLANGQTVEVPYGPYTDQTSVERWGAHSAEFVIQPVTETAAAVKSYADSILAANATPAVRLNALALPIRTPADVVPSRALLDLYDLVQVKNANAGVDQQMRVTSIEHTISAGQTVTDNRWTVQLSFTTTGNVASPQQAPTLTSATTVDTADTAWTNLAPLLSNGWVVYDAGRVPQYRRRNGEIIFRGLIKDGGNGTAAFTLPTGFRCQPREPGGGFDHHMPITANGAYASAYVNGSTGQVAIFGSTAWVDLSALRFMVAGA